MAVDKKALEKALDDIINEILPQISQADKAELKKRIVNALDDKDLNYDFREGSEKDPAIRNALKLACNAEFVNMKSPAPVFNIKLLFVNQYTLTNAQRKEYEKMLAEHLAMLLKALSKLQPKMKGLNKDHELEMIAAQLAQAIMAKSFKDSPFIAEEPKINATLSGLLEDPVRAFRIQFYGTDVAGGNEYTVQNNLAGNQMGVRNLDRNPTSLSNAAENYSANVTGNDYLGTHFLNLLERVADGANITPVAEAFIAPLQETAAPKFNPTPLPTKLTPFKDNK